MFEQENRPQQQISREAAERFAIMVANHPAQGRGQALPAARTVRKARSSVAESA